MIDVLRLCDGIADCPDASDETTLYCQNLVCPNNEQKCDYGACVNDLSICATGQKPPTLSNLTNGACRVNKIPLNGRVNLLAERPIELHVNAIVPNYSIVQFECNRNYYSNSSVDRSWCLNGKWTASTPKCELKCNLRRISSITYITHCTNGAEVIDRCGSGDLVEPGTTVRIVCQRGYQPATPHEQVTMCQNDGTWNRAILPCTQICGEESPDGKLYVVGGQITNNTKVPWHVGIYRTRGDEPTFICGGTILSPKLVVSAIHCFWNRFESMTYPENEFRVVAGKFYRKFNDYRERNTYQVLNIAKIHHLPGYNHRDGLFADDVAVVILDQYIEYKTHIAPICIDYNLSYEEKFISPGSIGRVAGWGLVQSNGNPSDELKMIEIPVINREQCKQSFHYSFRKFLTGDKFCAGEKNLGVGLCQGDSGGGLVFSKSSSDSKQVYFLRGIVSSGPNKDDSCDSNEYTLFTNIAHFNDFVKTYDYANRPEYVDIPPIEGTIAGLHGLTSMTTPKAIESTTHAAGQANTGIHCV